VALVAALVAAPVAALEEALAAAPWAQTTSVAQVMALE
jgi:hypothetical protein